MSVESFVPIQQSNIISAPGSITPASAQILDALTEPSKTLTYSCTLETYLKDSNAYGNIYFARYFEWQGVVRERWFSECIFENMLALEGALITKNASIEYLKPVFPFEKLIGTLTTSNIKNSSFMIHISFFKSSEIMATGAQTIVFADKSGKISKLPGNIKQKIKLYDK